MSVRIKFILILVLLLGVKTSLNAQRIALTSNILEDVVLTPNIGVDIVVADRQSLTLDTSIAPYKLSKNFYNKCLTFRVGYKFWLNQAFYAHYIGVDAVASSSDYRILNTDLKNEYVGVGLGYGYSFMLGKRLNLVPCIGVGLAYGTSYEGYDHMERPGVGVEAISTNKIIPIITRFGITIEYVLN